MAHLPYPSDPTEVECQAPEPLLPMPSRRGRARTSTFREMLTVIFLSSALGVRGAPRPTICRRGRPRITVGGSGAGLWEQGNTRLREHVRIRLG